MSARHRQPERVVTPRMKIADWSGTISPVDGTARAKLCDMSGSMICPATGWRLAITAVFDDGTIFVTASFDMPIAADDAAPWTLEHEMAKPHQLQAAGYDRRWTGAMPQVGKGAWAGEVGDRYGHVLKIDGKAQGGGIISLRAAVALGEVRG